MEKLFQACFLLWGVGVTHHARCMFCCHHGHAQALLVMLATVAYVAFTVGMHTLSGAIACPDSCSRSWIDRISCQPVDRLRPCGMRVERGHHPHQITNRLGSCLDMFTRRHRSHSSGRAVWRYACTGQATCRPR